MENSKNIAAVVVTFNRLDLLKKVIQSLKDQTYPIDNIIVVNNSSTDGTIEWLNEQSGLKVITQANTGSSGGQYTGFKTAFEDGYEWIWIMDDDVAPRNDCLEKLMQKVDKNTIVAPLRIGNDGKPLLLEIKDINMSNPFKSIWKRIITEKDYSDGFAKIDGMTFEGPLMHRSVIERIGLPEKKFFIYADDTEYSIRAIKNNIEILFIEDALLDRLLGYQSPDDGFTWKHYFVIRNIIAIDILHGPFYLRMLRPFGYLIAWIFKSKSFKDLRTTLKAFRDGYFYKSEN